MLLYLWTANISTDYLERTPFQFIAESIELGTAPAKRKG